MKKQINWQPEHFPQGTIVRLCNFSKKENGIPHYSHIGEGIETEIESVFYCGFGQGWLATSCDDGLFDQKFIFNFSHITSIVKRGNGKVTFTKQVGQGSFKPTVTSTTVAKSKRRYYFSNNVDLSFYVLTMFPHAPIVLGERLFECVLKQSFIRKEPHNHGSYFHLLSVDKKKFKRFIKQNFNRFKDSNKTIKAFHDKYLDYDDLRDCYEPETTEENKDTKNPSHYDGYDGRSNHYTTNSY